MVFIILHHLTLSYNPMVSMNLLGTFLFILAISPAFKNISGKGATATASVR